MKRNQARVINQKTKDLSNQVANNNEQKFDIKITSEDLIRLTEQERWYDQTDMAKVAEYYINLHGYNFKQQFEVIGGLNQLNKFLNKSVRAAVSPLPIFVIYNERNNHWVTFCITHHESNIAVLYKDSFGESISDDIKNTINESFSETIFKSHAKREQQDGSSCGPMALTNMQIILQGLKNNKESFINEFENVEFCIQQNVKLITHNFKDNLQKHLSNKLEQYIKALVQDEQYEDFKDHLNKFLDTCCEYVGASIPGELYYKVLLEEIDKQEKNPNYTIDKTVIEEAKREFLEHKQIREIIEQQTNKAQVSKIEESNYVVPDVQTRFPEQMQKFTKIFDFLTNVKKDEKLATVLQDVSKMLKIDYGKIKQFFEAGMKNEPQAKGDSEKIIKPKTIQQIKQDIPAFKGIPGPDPSEKSLEQLLSELALGGHADESSSTKIDLTLSLDERAEQYQNIYKNSKEILQLDENYTKVKAHYQHWQDKTVEHILDWAMEKRKTFEEKDLYEAIAVMDRANELVTGGDKLRDTQILSVLRFLQPKKSTGVLCQISTGEGKTTIVSLAATLNVLQGKKVDVITSNQVLAGKGVESRVNFYSLFNVSVATNNIDEAYRQGPRACYSADVVYGSIGNFQFDYLRDSFEGLETRANRGFDIVILDEVDSMLVDNGGYIAKLAEPFPGIDCLKYAYIKIWQELHKAEAKSAKDLEQRLKTKAEELKQKVGTPEELLQEEYESYRAGLCATQFDELKKYIKATNPADIKLIPMHLKSYAEKMVDTWIDSAMYAKYQCNEYEQYIIKKRNNEDVIVPVDYQNTGVTLKNTVWSNGVHQFVQLKHNLNLTSESLTSSFISNIGYIKLYNHNILGLTGTLGSLTEQELLSTVYDVDYVLIPTYKRKKFQEIEGIFVKDDQWLNCIALDTMRLAYQGGSVLIICKTIKDLQDLENKMVALKELEGFDALKIKTYPDEDSSHIVDEVINSSEVIIATNIAGRGTDLSTSVELEQRGGLHVCLSFLPVNQRVEEQAFGRTARQGKAGTAQLIVRESDVTELGVEITAGINFQTIKKKRDEIEKQRLDKVRNKKLTEIAFQDSIFGKFSKLYRDFKQNQMRDPGQKFVIMDLKEYWAFWLQNQDFKNLGLNKVQEAFEDFKQAAGNILAGNIAHNPYYSIDQADLLLDNKRIDQAKIALNYAIHLSKDHAELLYSAYLKLFEVSVESGNQLRERFKKALKEVILIPNVEKNENYKEEAKSALEKAKKALETEICYLQNHFIGKSLDVQNSDASETAVPTNADFRQILTHEDNNLLVKHIVSRYSVLNFFHQHTESLLDQINTKNSGLALNTKIPNYLGKLQPITVDEQNLKNGITDTELAEFGQIGLDTIYALREVFDAPKEVIRRAQGQIAGGLSVFAMGAAFPPALPAMGPIASTLISEGTCDIAIELINKGGAPFSEQAYIKGKCISYGITVATMGISAIVKYTKILEKAIDACKELSKMLRKCPVWQSLCNKIATHIDEIGIFLQRMSSQNVSQAAKISSGAKQIQHFQMSTKHLVKIGKTTLQGVVGSVIAEKVVNEGLHIIMQKLKPTIEKNVRSTVTRLLTEEQLKSIDQKLINEILIGSYGEFATDILKEVALGVLRHSNNWKAKLASIAFDTGICIKKTIQYTESFCFKLQKQLMLQNQESNRNFQENSEVAIELITKLVAEKIYREIIQLAGKYAHTFVVIPLMQKVWKLCDGKDKKKVIKDLGKPLPEPFEFRGPNFSSFIDSVSAFLRLDGCRRFCAAKTKQVKTYVLNKFNHLKSSVEYFIYILLSFVIFLFSLLFIENILIQVLFCFLYCFILYSILKRKFCCQQRQSNDNLQYN